jgi:hypothetical protein
VGSRFSAPVQTDPGVHLASLTMGTGSFPVVNPPRSGVDQPPLSSAVVKERVELYLYSPSGLSWPVLGQSSALTFKKSKMLSVLSEAVCSRGFESR